MAIIGNWMAININGHHFAMEWPLSNRKKLLNPFLRLGPHTVRLTSIGARVAEYRHYYLNKTTIR